MTLRCAVPGTGKRRVDDGRGVPTSQNNDFNPHPINLFANLRNKRSKRCVVFAIFALRIFLHATSGLEPLKCGRVNVDQLLKQGYGLIKAIAKSRKKSPIAYEAYVGWVTKHGVSDE